MNLRKGVILLVGVLMIATSVLGQSKVIDIWNGKVPGSIPNPAYKQFVDSVDWIKIRHITNPTLLVYPAPADNNTGTAVLVCPGGGYYGISFVNEGTDIAKWLNKLGVSAFVLYYRLPDDAIMKDKSIAPLQDAQRAMRIVRRNAKEWGVNPHKIGIMGFSAGGHVASTLSTHFNEKVYDPVDSISARPDFSVLVYPVISMDSAITHMGSRVSLLGNHPSPEMVNHFSNELQVTSKTPPAFIVHAMDDFFVPTQNSIRYALALREHKIPCELHIYQTGGHGFGLSKCGGTQSSWPDACSKWLKERGFLQAK